MVTSGEQFLIDATFIAEKTHKTFLGAPLLTMGGQDCTFVFGFLREFLRLRHTLRISAGLVLVGRDTYSVSSRDSIHGVIASFKELGIPHIHDPLNLTLNLALSISSHFSHIITADENFLQLTGESLIVVLPRKGKEREWDWMSSKIVKDRIGIAPHHVPTYIALTDAPNTVSLTNRQAIRLIESFGDVDGIYGKLGQIVPVPTRVRLAKFEAQIRSIYTAKKCRHVEALVLKPFSKFPLNKLDTAINRRHLVKYGFPSLSVLLRTPPQMQCDLPENVCSPISYHAVVDRKALQQLKSLVCASKLCAVDVESDSKDPRTANLLGIAFSVKIGEAYFVPLTALHLKGLSERYALGMIKQIVNSGVAFVGHNIKYDSLILRRAGARIRNVHFDTMLATFECHGDWPFFNLAYVCKRVLGKEIKSYSDTVCDDSTFLDLPLTEMVNHACQDADFALRLYPALSDQLEERCIAKQFLEHTMKHLERLSNLEFDGMAINLERVRRIRKGISRQAEHLRLSICRTVGRVVDLGSQQDLAAALREIAQLQGYVVPRRVTVSILEQLALREPLARQMLKFKRLRNLVGRLDAISAIARNGRIYPLFNQISSCAGLTTSRPNLFASEAMPELKSSFERGVRDLFTDPAQSMRTLGEITNDPNLQRVGINKFNDRAERIESPSYCARYQDDHLLLRLAIGQSDAELCRRFIIGRLKMESIRNHLEKKYKRMFQWLTKFRRMALDNGYAENGEFRKYIDGLKSADLARRRQAVENAVRWLIRY